MKTRTPSLFLAVASAAVACAVALAQTGSPSAIHDAPPGLVHWLDAGRDAGDAPAASTELLARGRAVYGVRCGICHGDAGAGDGPAAAYLPVPPRDFTRGVYKFRTTTQDGMPADLDLFRSITAGFPAYGMPSFAWLDPKDRWALVGYLKSLYPAWDRLGRGAAVNVGREPPPRPDSLGRGQTLYETTFNCAQCHGPLGRGDGPRVAELRDYKQRPIAPRVFTGGPVFRKAGWRLADTVRILTTGVAGTPMPSHADQLADPTDLTDLWDVARYVKHLEGRTE